METGIKEKFKELTDKLRKISVKTIENTKINCGKYINKSKEFYSETKDKVKPVYNETKEKTKLLYQQTKEKTKSFNYENKKNTNFTYKMAGTAIAVIGLVSVAGIQINHSLSAFSVEINDNVLAIVREEEDFLEVVEIVKEEISSLYGQEVVLTEEPVFVKTKSKNKNITESDEIVARIKEQIDIKIKAVAININSEDVAIVKDMKTAEDILEDIKHSYIKDEEENYDDIDFVERVQIVEVATEFNEIITKDEALQKIAIGTDEERIHEVESGENTWTIAGKYNLTMDEIASANPDLDPKRLQIGQQISLIVPKPLATVRTKSYVELVEEIDFDTEYEDTGTLYKGDKKITVQGQEGKRELKAYIVKENGIEVEKEILEEKIIKEPKTRIIAQGTKERPATMATGIFSNPSRGRLTSPFGMRWGRRHTGIDVAASRGTTVAAADAGRVSFAGTNGAYGKLVIIDHENGYQTYYAHNSNIVVKKGDRVYKGQKVAEMGSTGRSTGTHLHFEVRKNGNPVNPQQFVKY